MSSFLPNSYEVVANGASIIEFGVHVVVVGSLWLSGLWTVWLPELGHWVSFETKQWFMWCTKVKQCSTLPIKCESTILHLKWKLFLLPQTHVPHKILLTHYLCGTVETIQQNISYSPPLWRRWLSIQVRQSLFRTKGSDTICWRSFFTMEHWTLWDFFF